MLKTLDRIWYIFVNGFHSNPQPLLPAPTVPVVISAEFYFHFDAPHTCKVALVSVFLAIADAAFNTEFPMTAP
jgi:hypothetical protein